MRTRKFENRPPKGMGPETRKKNGIECLNSQRNFLSLSLPFLEGRQAWCEITVSGTRGTRPRITTFAIG